jgi:hypothetical protein
VDDVTIILSSPTDVEAVRTALNFYQPAAVATLKLTKTKTPQLGILNTEIVPMGIIYVKKGKSLNMIFDLTIAVDTRFTWSSFVTLN